jgi:hypothetical protein
MVSGDIFFVKKWPFRRGSAGAFCFWQRFQMVCRNPDARNEKLWKKCERPEVVLSRP